MASQYTWGDGQPATTLLIYPGAKGQCHNLCVGGWRRAMQSLRWWAKRRLSSLSESSLRQKSFLRTGKIVTVGPCLQSYSSLFLAESMAGPPWWQLGFQHQTLAFLVWESIQGTRIHLPLRFLTVQSRCWYFQTFWVLHGQQQGLLRGERRASQPIYPRKEPWCSYSKSGDGQHCSLQCLQYD